MEEEDAPKENAFSFRDASASEEDATSSGASKQDAAPKEEDVSSSSGASKENNAYASTEENSSSSFGESKRRTFRRRRTRFPSPRQSRHVNGERRVRLEGGGHVLLLWRVKEEHAPKLLAIAVRRALSGNTTEFCLTPLKDIVLDCPGP